MFDTSIIQLNYGKHLSDPFKIFRRSMWGDQLTMFLFWDLILSGSGDWTIKLWNSLTGNPISSFEGHSDDVFSIGFYLMVNFSWVVLVTKQMGFGYFYLCINKKIRSSFRSVIFELFSGWTIDFEGIDKNCIKEKNT